MEERLVMQAMQMQNAPLAAAAARLSRVTGKPYGACVRALVANDATVLAALDDAVFERAYTQWVLARTTAELVRLHVAPTHAGGLGGAE